MVPSGMPYPAVASHSLQLTLDRWWSYLDIATARTSGASEPTPVFKAFCTALRSIPARRFDLATAVGGCGGRSGQTEDHLDFQDVMRVVGSVLAR